MIVALRAGYKGHVHQYHTKTLISVFFFFYFFIPLGPFCSVNSDHTHLTRRALGVLPIILHRL